MTRPEPKLSDLLDADALAAELAALHADHGDGGAFRAHLLAVLKEVVRDGRSRIERMLTEDGKGLLCARRLASHQDQLIRALFSVATRTLWRATNPSSAERMSVIAVGGYGRGTLAPGSDIDLLFLLPYKQTAWGESIVEFILYTLWDLGFKVGHATRTTDECLRLAQTDITIRTAILDARPICGDTDLFDEFTTRFDRTFGPDTASDFIAAKLEERDQRHQRSGQSRYLVEPNVKDGKGGQRDLNTLFWLARYVYRVETFDALAAEGVFTRAEVTLYRKCDDFLWAVRCHLHFLTGKAEERLSFDLQVEMAERLGYQSHPGLSAVERFMKHYFLVAKDVGDLTRILCAALEVDHLKQTPVLSRFMQRFRRRKPGRLDDSDDFEIEHERIGIADDRVFDRDPVNLLRLFQLADKYNLQPHPDALRVVRRSLALIDRSVREDADANAIFLALLTSGKDPERVLRLMNEAGVLGRFVPDFGRVVSMMQFNMYHHFTVDEHLIRAVGILADLERGALAQEHPLASELIGRIDNRRVLYVAMFLHDIAKGRPEDHSIAGAKVALKLCPRFGLSEAETAAVAWLIREHLTMSMTAQSRDLQDPRTIADFAELVQSPERLRLLLVLTEADIRAVGPGVFNAWKRQLLATLYHETLPVLTGQSETGSSTGRAETARQRLAEALADWPDDERQAVLGVHQPSYWLNTDLDRQLLHADLLRESHRSGSALVVKADPAAARGATLISVLAPDHPRLLSQIAGACAAVGGNIVDAQIFTTTDGRAIDTITLQRAFDNDEDELRRGDRIREVLDRTFAGQMSLDKAIASKARGRKRARAFDLTPDVVLSNTWSDSHTVIEASGLDRPGLLRDLTTVLAELGLDIASARVATFGERAVDVFYVSDLVGQQITNARRQARIKRKLTEALVNGVRKAA